MKINSKLGQAVVELNVVIDHNDAVALGVAFAPFKELIKTDDKYQEWCNMPYDERNKKDENGNPIHPRPESASMNDAELVHRMRRIVKFIDKIAVYPNASDIFE